MNDTAALGRDIPLTLEALRQAEVRRALVRRLTPVIRARVAQTLRRRSAMARGRRLEQEVADMTQEVFLTLFERQGHVLRSWDPARGASLEGFVGLVAEREAACILRSGRRTPWAEDPTEPETLERYSESEPEAEARVGSKQLLTTILDRLRAKLSIRGLEVFETLYVRELPVAEAAEVLGMSTGALYVWRNRLKSMALEIARETEAQGRQASKGSNK